MAVRLTLHIYLVLYDYLFIKHIDIISQIVQIAESLLKEATSVVEAHNISLYRKYNRLRDGDLALGSHAPNIPLLNGDLGAEYLLGTNTSRNDMHVIVAGSLS